MSDNLIKLQTAYIRQSRDIKENAWVVFSDKDEELFTLSNKLSPKEAMSYLHFARPFELEAFNIGIDYGREIEMERSEDIFKKMRGDLIVLEEMNERLSNQLAKFIIGTED